MNIENTVKTICTTCFVVVLISCTIAVCKSITGS